MIFIETVCIHIKSNATCNSAKYLCPTCGSVKQVLSYILVFSDSFGLILGYVVRRLVTIIIIIKTS